jgi:crotonobetainyl-CoA:carnitine CoA-transferase CaiB-like acyl-CoA transferase
MADPPRLPVEEVGVACVRAALEAAARLGGGALDVAIDPSQVHAALVSERLFRLDGAPAGVGFAPLSRFWRAADGWVRTHANFPWHHAALLRALGVDDDAAVEAAIAARPAADVEAAVFAAGGVAAAVRTPDEWRATEAGAAVAAEPLVARVRLGDADPRPPRCGKCADGLHNPHRSEAGGDDGAPPAAGVRVLDLTRVIAGPVASRYLGALGADVLRLDPPRLPDLEPGAPADTLLGKRSAFLDLGDEAGARRLKDLLAGADVVLLGYRPGALARFGLAPEDLAERHPGLVIAQLSAWGHSGPWAERRGFDSIVQAASGIADLEAGEEGEPGALPCQLLDHGTGYLAAAAVLAALAEQRRDGGTHLARLSLARTAAWLLEAGPDVEGAPRGAKPRPGVGSSPTEAGAGPPPDAGSPRAAGPPRAADSPRDESPAKAEPWHVPGAAFVAPVDSDPELAAVPPPGSLAGTLLRWPAAARYGADAPTW